MRGGGIQYLVPTIHWNIINSSSILEIVYAEIRKIKNIAIHAILHKWQYFLKFWSKYIGNYCNICEKNVVAGSEILQYFITKKIMEGK